MHYFRVDRISGAAIISRLEMEDIFFSFLLYGQISNSDNERGYHNSLNTETFNINSRDKGNVKPHIH
jgi:hypothetical protein